MVDAEAKNNLTSNRLSKLQKWILATAYAFHFRRRRDPDFREDYDSDIDFPTIKRDYFNVQSKADPRYNSANASVSRTAARLKRTGLVRIVFFRTWYRHGMELTDEGLRFCEANGYTSSNKLGKG